MEKARHDAAAINAAGHTIRLPLLNLLSLYASATLLVLIVAGCATRPLPVRPSVDDLVEQSLNQSLANYQIDDPSSVDFFASEIATEIIGQIPGQMGMSQVAPGEGLSIDGTGQPITFTDEFIETDVSEVMVALAEAFDVEMTIGPNVNGIVNAQLDNLTIDQAIEKVLVPLDFHYARQGNQYYIADGDPESPLFPYISERREYRPMHLEMAEMMKTVPSKYEPYVQAINGANLILVEAPNRIVDQVVQRFAQIDQPVPQVILEAIICVIEPDTGFQFGLDWQHAVELNGNNALKLGASGLALSGTYSKAGANALFSDFAQTSSFVKLLSEHGYLTIRASPHVMAEDNKPAKIAINRETFFSVQPQNVGTGNNQSFFVQQNIQEVKAGISLDFTPHIRGDTVTLDIEKAEVSEDIRNANTELSLNPFPIINRRSVSTTVHVKDGKTIVIGGLVQRETIDRVNRVPGLSKIPLIGYLFETTQRQTRDAEVVIFISPRIVRPPRIME